MNNSSVSADAFFGGVLTATIVWGILWWVSWQNFYEIPCESKHNVYDCYLVMTPDYPKENQ